MRKPETPADLRRLRRELHWTQRQLARLLGVSQARLSQVEGGKAGDQIPASWTTALQREVGKLPKGPGSFRVPVTGNELRDLRLKLGLHQAPFGEQVSCCSGSRISQLERSEGRLPEAFREELRIWLESRAIAEATEGTKFRDMLASENRPPDHDQDDWALPWPCPRTGMELRVLVEKLIAGGASLSDLLHVIEIEPSELIDYYEEPELSGKLMRSIRSVLAEMVHVPRTGSGLRRLLRDLEDFGVEGPERKIAKIARVSVSSVKQYSSRQQLPRAFQHRLKDYYRR